MAPELQKYYEDRFSMMATDGWVDLMADIDHVALPDARISQARLYAVLHAIRLQETTYKSAGSVHACAINLGRRPTFFEHADHSLLEAHLLDFAGDLYGQHVNVTFEHFLRSERKFDGLEAIKTQLQLDVAAARLALL